MKNVSTSSSLSPLAEPFTVNRSSVSSQSPVSCAYEYPPEFEVCNFTAEADKRASGSLVQAQLLASSSNLTYGGCGKNKRLKSSQDCSLIDKSVKQMDLDLLVATTSEIRVTSPMEKSFDVDSDVDSPCYKGTLFNKGKSFHEDEPLNSLDPQLSPVKDYDADDIRPLSSNLNPRAPHFLPANAIQIRENQSPASFASTLSGTYTGKVARVVGSDCAREPGLSFETTTRWKAEYTGKAASVFASDCARESGLPFELTTSRKAESVTLELNPFAPIFSPQDKECIGDQNSNILRIVASSSMLNLPVPSSTLSFYVTEKDHASSSSTTVKATHQSLIQSSPPDLDLQSLVKIVHELLELLIGLQNLPNSVESLNEHDRTLVQSLIKNLCLYIKNKGQLTTMFESPQLEEAAKCNNSIFQVVSNNGVSQTGEDINAQAMLYKSLWLNAEAEVRLMKYKASLLNTNNESRRS